jgi:hypothetical protein
VRNDLSTQLPKARKDQLIVKELPEETLIYDLRTDKAHCLNSTAALVWKNCDGQRTVENIVAVAEQETGSAIDERLVWLGLEQLNSSNLLESAPAMPGHLAGMTRRQLVRHIGAAALALPVIMSIASPTPAQGASACACTTPNCRPAGCPCANPGDCVNPLSCTGPPGSKTCQ